MKPAAVARAESLLGREAKSWTAVQNPIASSNERWLVRFADGASAFVKAAFDEETSADWLRTEHLVYSEVEASFMPRLLGWADEARPVLVLEDLSDAFWPPPWSDERIQSVLATLDELGQAPPPAGLPRLADFGERLTGGWREIAADPEPFLSLGVCSREWLDAALPPLARASETAPLAGEALVHFDVRSDNLCFRGSQAILIDWNWAAIGNPLFDLAAWLPSLALEGGPAPQELLPGSEAAGAAALLAGFFGVRAGLPPPPTAPFVRPLQLGQLRFALPWAAELLGLPPPE